MGPVEWLLGNIVGLYIGVVFVNAVLSWLITFDIVNRNNRVVNTIEDVTTRLTEPALQPIRTLIPNLGGVDLSPVALILGLQMLQRFVIKHIPF